VLAASDRGTTPLVKKRSRQARTGRLVDGARSVVSRFKSISGRHGPEATAFLSTGQICTEEMALLGALAKIWDGK